MPREQDPEINFNWVIITTAVPGASAEDVEKRVTQPLEDAIKQVADIRFVASSSRENISSILVRFDDISERVFDKRINDLRREMQNKAEHRTACRGEGSARARDHHLERLPHGHGADDRRGRRRGTAPRCPRHPRRPRAHDRRRPGASRSVCSEPELRVEFDPHALQARGLTPTDVADSVKAWFRDIFAGKARAGATDWLVRVAGRMPIPATWRA